MKRHNSENHFTDTVFQRTGLVILKVNNWKTVSYKSSKKHTLNRAHTNKDKKTLH